MREKTHQRLCRKIIGLLVKALRNRYWHGSKSMDDIELKMKNETSCATLYSMSNLLDVMSKFKQLETLLLPIDALPIHYIITSSKSANIAVNSSHLVPMKRHYQSNKSESNRFT